MVLDGIRMNLDKKSRKRKVNCQSMGKSSPDPIFRINQASEKRSNGRNAIYDQISKRD